MAHPFAAHHEGARVESGGREWWGNCAWDGLGIVAALGLRDGDDHGAGHHVAVRDGDVSGDAVFHVLVPGAALVGRHRLHLSDDAAPPVGGGGDVWGADGSGDAG